MIMIRLGFQEHTVDVDGQLFDHGMRQIGHRIQVGGVRQIGRRAGLKLDLHFKVTSCAFRLSPLLTVLPKPDTTEGICKAPPY